MRRTISLLITPFILVCSASYAADHKGKKELEVLSLIAGDYTYEFAFTGEDSTTGKLSFKRFANDQFIMFDEVFDINDSDSVGVHGIIGYDRVEDHFTWYRVFSNGGYDHGKGHFSNGVITFNMTKTRLEPFGEMAWDGPGIKLRTKWMDFTETGWNFTWEQSKDGGPWKELGKGRTSKKK